MRIPGTRVVSLPLTGGIDEISPANKLAPEDCLKMENFRLSKEGSRIEKRKGLTEEVTDFAEDLYGYTTYYDSSSNFCQLAILESQIKRKVAAGAWTSIHTFSSNIAHPVRPLEIQGKQFIINEVDSRMIHTNSSDYQIGITAPTTLPTATAAYVATTLPLDDTMNYANQAAMDAVWTDADSGSTSVLSTTDPDGKPGPNADAKYMRFYDTAPASGRYSKRTKTVANVGNSYTLEFAIYCDVIGYIPWFGYYTIDIYNGLSRFQVVFTEYAVLYYNGIDHVVIREQSTPNQWQTWKFVVNSNDPSNATFEAFLNGASQGNFSFSNATTSNAGLLALQGYHYGTTYSNCDVYIDYIKIGGTGGDSAQGQLKSKYRYAVTYARSGDYGCESNPIKSVVGSKTFTGTGLNDLTPGGTYTGDEDITVKVQIDGTGTPDTIKISYDNGETWHTSTLQLTTTMYLNYGLTLTWGATTGHTSGDYWTFPCSGCYAATANQKVTLTSIPVSADPQVDQRKIYRSVAGGSRFYWLATINNNTTTTFVDNIPDAMLGVLLEEDHDVMPNGKFSAWWDDRLWVSGDDIVYYSEPYVPEHFSLSKRYVTIQKGDIQDEITQLWPFKDSLYILVNNNIFVIQKTTLGYGVYLINNDIGCVAPWSMIEANNLLCFISYRGIEAYNGVDVYPIELSLPIDRTIKTIDTTKYSLICSTQFKERREIWISLPDRTGGNSACTLVYNYLTGKNYIFSFYKTPSCIVSCLDSSKALVNKMGTRDGYLCLCESGYQDGTTNITATYRKGWIDVKLYADIVKLEVEYEIPVTKTLTAKVYVNFAVAAARTASLTGETLTSTDIELRRPIYEFAELGQRAKYFSVEFTNAENLGGDLKINDIKVHYYPRILHKKVYGG